MTETFLNTRLRSRTSRYATPGHWIILSIACLLFLMPTATSAQQIEWQTDVETAKKLARQQNRLVLLHFYADWCRPCRELDLFVFRDLRVIQSVNATVIPVKVNADQAIELTKKYSVEAVPYDVIIHPSGRVLARRKSPHEKQGYLTMMERAGNIIDQYQSGDAAALEQSLDEVEQLLQVEKNAFASQREKLTPDKPMYMRPRASVNSSNLKRFAIERGEFDPANGGNVSPTAFAGQEVPEEEQKVVENPFFNANSTVAKPGPPNKPAPDGMTPPTGQVNRSNQLGNAGIASKHKTEPASVSQPEVRLNQFFDAEQATKVKSQQAFLPPTPPQFKNTGSISGVGREPIQVVSSQQETDKQTQTTVASANQLNLIDLETTAVAPNFAAEQNNDFTIPRVARNQAAQSPPPTSRPRSEFVVPKVGVIEQPNVVIPVPEAESVANVEPTKPPADTTNAAPAANDASNLIEVPEQAEFQFPAVKWDSQPTAQAPSANTSRPQDVPRSTPSVPIREPNLMTEAVKSDNSAAGEGSNDSDSAVELPTARETIAAPTVSPASEPSQEGPQQLTYEDSDETRQTPANDLQPEQSLGSPGSSIPTPEQLPLNFFDTATAPPSHPSDTAIAANPTAQPAGSEPNAPHVVVGQLAVPQQPVVKRPSVVPKTLDQSGRTNEGKLSPKITPENSSALRMLERERQRKLLAEARLRPAEAAGPGESQPALQDIQIATHQPATADSPDQSTAPEIGLTAAQSRTDMFDRSKYALQGKCPVTLVTDGEWVDGSKEVGCVHRDRVFLFASEAKREQFLSDPDKFSPILAGFDPVIYCETGKLTEGLESFGLFMGRTEQRRVVLFVSPDTQQRFKQTPRKYLDAVRGAMKTSR